MSSHSPHPVDPVPRHRVDTPANGRHRRGRLSASGRGVALAVVALFVVVIAGRQALSSASTKSSHRPATTAVAASAAATAATPVTSASPTSGPASSAPGASAARASDRFDSGTKVQVPVPASATSFTAPVPTGVRIPSIDVDSPLDPLRQESDGTLEPPPQWQRAGWYVGGVRPGDVGPAVIAGHVDSHLGPAVFYHLSKLRPGDDVQVRSAHGPTLHFTVTGTQQFTKAKFPTAVLYGPTPLRELKLVTCTGAFDRSVGHYLDNLIVTAVLRDVPAA